MMLSDCLKTKGWLGISSKHMCGGILACVRRVAVIIYTHLLKFTCCRIFFLKFPPFQTLDFLLDIKRILNREIYRYLNN